jgi:valyl-tRNA synthetase
MPYVTEELWQRLPNGSGKQPTSIMLAAFPTSQPQWQSTAVEQEMEAVLEVVRAVRTLRAGCHYSRFSPSLLASHTGMLG